jgi:xylan 1,4-beta-xylosidase
VLAPAIVRHGGRFFIYFPGGLTAPAGQGRGTYVVHADSITGPWSDPVLVYGGPGIDPGHVVGEDGRRYLFLSGITRVALSDDGLTAVGSAEKVYDGWRYPDDWITEAYAVEGPKIFRRDNYFYLVGAVGGTGGPPTGIAARSRSIDGPWENCPHNPVVRTQEASEAWWSRGHASLVEGPAGDWWMVYHGYEDGFRTLGRQTLLEPVDWTRDGWFVA